MPDNPAVVLQATGPMAHVTGRDYWAMLQRAKTLGLYTRDVRACRTLGDLKPLVKRRFHVLAKAWHPDVVRHTGQVPRQHVTAKATYGRFLRHYEWFMRQADALVLHHPETVPDLPMPWALERRALALPAGYQEALECLWWR